MRVGYSCLSCLGRRTASDPNTHYEFWSLDRIPDIGWSWTWLGTFANLSRPPLSVCTDLSISIQGVQMPMIALQAALPQTQVPEGIALMVFTQILGAAVFIQAGQNIFTNRLVHNVLATGIPINIQKILSQGLRNVVDLVSPEDRDKIILAYNKSITQVRTFTTPYFSL